MRLGPQINDQAGSGSGFVAPPAIILFVIALILGWGLVAWRTQAGAERGRGLARREAQAKAAAIEIQFREASVAAELLGALVKQAGGAQPFLRQVAAEQIASNPRLASIQIQAGGVVTDVVPRGGGNERLLGLNVLNDPVQGPGAQEAIKRHAGTGMFPMSLASGKMGMVTRVPVFLRGRDGREAFWGFVAASMELEEALKQARVYELGAHGYDYHFYLPGTAEQKPISIVAQGVYFQDAVQQPVHALGFDFGLAVRPHGGWFSKTRLAFECLAVTVAAALVALLVHALGRGRELEEMLADAEKRLVGEAAERSQVQRDARAASERVAAVQTEMKQLQSAQAQAETAADELRHRLGAEARKVQEDLVAAKETLRQRELEARRVQTGLEEAVQAAQAATRESEAAHQKSRAMLAESRKRIGELEERLGVLARVEEESRTQIAQMQSRLEAATRMAREKLASAKGPPKDSALEFDAPAVQPPAIQGESTPASSRRTEETPPPQPAEALPVANELSEDRTEPLVRTEVATAGKRKRGRRDNQMDLFERRPAPELTAASSEPATDTGKPESIEPQIVAGPEPTPERSPSKVEAETVAVLESRKDGSISHAPAEGVSEEKLARPRSSRPQPPVDISELRRAANEIVALLAGEDPGARDCFKANRAAFRSAFTPDSYLEFEQCVRAGEFSVALEQLRKVTKKHGLSV